MSYEGLELDGRYRLVRLLGSGGMGDVYVATDPQQEREVAIKIIRAERSYSGEEVTKEEERLFRREARMIARLDHPCTLALYDYGQVQHNNLTLYYLVMPYRAEGSLADWLRTHGGISQLTPDDGVALIKQAAEALQHAHDHQVIHQDIKPSNFLVETSEDGTARPSLILSDFGIARLSITTSSASQSIRGTPTYMAPEQWEGRPVYATDQYGLAIMAYELLTGQLPFQGNATRMMYAHLNTPPAPPSSVNPHLSAQVDRVLLRALAKKPQMRFPSVAAFADALSLAVAGKLSEEAFVTLGTSQADETSSPVAESTLPFVEKTGLSYKELVKLRAASITAEEANASPNEPVLEQARGNRAKVTHELTSGLQLPLSGKQKPPQKRSFFVLLAAALTVVLIFASVTAALALRGRPPVGQADRSGGQTTQGSTITPTATPARQLAFRPSPTSVLRKPTPTPTPVLQSNPTSGSGIQPIVPPAPIISPTVPTVPPTQVSATVPVSIPPAISVTPTLVDRAASVTQSSSPTVQENQQFLISFTLQNTGTTTWSDNGGYIMVCITNCLGAGTIGFNGQTVTPGQQFSFNITQISSTTPGTYTTQWVLQDNGTPFGPTMSLVVNVLAPPTPVPAPTTPTPTWQPLLVEAAPDCNNPAGTSWNPSLPGTVVSCSNGGLLMQQTSASYYAELDLTQAGGGYYSQTNFRVQVDATFMNTSDNSTWAALLVQTPVPQGAVGGFIFVLNPAGQWQLQQVITGTSIPVVASGTTSINPGQATNITIIVQNATLYGYVNGNQVLAWSDSSTVSPALTSLMVERLRAAPSSNVLYTNYELDMWG